MGLFCSSKERGTCLASGGECLRGGGDGFYYVALRLRGSDILGGWHGSSGEVVVRGWFALFGVLVLGGGRSDGNFGGSGLAVG